MGLITGVFFLAGFQLPNLPVPVPSAPVPVPSEAGKAISVGAKAAQKSMVAAKGISDSEEYYIGRAVAARLLSRNSLSQNQAATTYINEVGEAVAKKSTMPRTYRGYHFGILETSDPNAYACPGGIILITRGLIKECQNEDELAAVLAHEVAHIANKDGIKSINKSRWTEVLTSTGAEAARQYGGGVAGSLVSMFESSIDDVFKTLVVNGYSRAAEENADRAAVTTLTRAGYNPAALAAILSRLSSKGGGGGIFTSHPLTSQRVEAVKMLAREGTKSPQEQVRTKRFQQMRF
uniref:Peptidase M48 n=1 Tax=Desulfobacca acetoxidans TaxID=60893 RepID=A0A7V6A2F9_9BACT